MLIGYLKSARHRLSLRTTLSGQVTAHPGDSFARKLNSVEAATFAVASRNEHLCSSRDQCGTPLVPDFALEIAYEQLLRQGVIVRSMSAYGYPRYIRVNVGLPEENDRFIRSLDKIRSNG